MTFPRFARRPECMPLAVVTETWPPEINGVATTVARFVTGLADRGHDVTVIRPRQSPDDAGLHEAAGLRTIVAPGFAIPRYPELRMGWPALRLLESAWRARPPRLVHIATEGPLGWAALRVASRMEIPVSADYRTHFDAYSAHYGIGWLRRPITAWLRHFHNRCGVTMVPTESLRRVLAADGFERLRVVARGVDTTRFDPARRSDALRASWGATPDSPVAIVVGRVAPEKNLGLALRAYAAMRAARPDAKLVVVGDGPSRDALARQCPQAVFAGARRGEDLAAHYASADLFLFPSLTETFGNVVLEALASGLPVVAYAAAAAAEHVRPGASGWLAVPGDEQAFVDGAVSMTMNLAFTRRCGRAARRHALPLGWPALVEQFESILLAEARRRTSDGIAPLRPDAMVT